VFELAANGLLAALVLDPNPDDTLDVDPGLFPNPEDVDPELFPPKPNPLVWVPEVLELLLPKPVFDPKPEVGVPELDPKPEEPDVVEGDVNGLLAELAKGLAELFEKPEVPEVALEVLLLNPELPELFPNPDTVLDEVPELFPNPDTLDVDPELFPNPEDVDPELFPPKPNPLV